MLHVDLQEGFDNDAVQLRLDGRTIYDSTGVSTDMRISRADAVEVPIAEGPLELTVSLPERDISGSLTVRGSGTTYVGVSIQEGSVRFTVSDEPFRYM